MEQATVSIDLDRPTTEVWEALAEPERLAAWMGEGSTIDLRPGGEVRLADLVTGVPKRGHVSWVEPERAIEFVWWPEDDPDQASHVSLVMHPIGERTRFTVVERRPALASAVATAGWSWRTAVLALATTRPVVGALG